MNQLVKRIIPSAIIAVGLVVIGVGVRSGLKSISERHRSVDVRGLAERTVDADKVTWPISYKLTDNDLQSLNARLSASNAVVRKFLEDGGINSSEISVVAPNITDNMANSYRTDAAFRYIGRSVIVVSTNKVSTVNSLIAKVGELVDDGIIIENNDYSNPTVYEFTGLNDIKPQMIAEATQSAREAADKFAADSDSKIGKILTATQGTFSIEDRDNYTPYIKNVRVVTYITFSLED